jgi:DegV family protein with EDD domain
MNNYLIITDSTTDLPQEYMQNPNLRIIPLHFTMNGEEFADGQMDSKAFYDRVRKGSLPTTSQINPDRYLDLMTPLLEEGKDLLVIAFSSGLSGTANSMRIAISELSEKYPGRTILGIDSLCASMGEGLLVHYALESLEKGMNIEDNHSYLENLKLKICHWFTVEDLNHLRRGGRLSGFSAFIGTVLKIKPVLNVNNEGHLIPRKKVIGRKSSIEKLFSELEKEITEAEKQVVFISHGDCLEDAEYLKGLITQRFNVKKVVINPIGSVIGSHSGPGTLALFFIGNNR